MKKLSTLLLIAAVAAGIDANSAEVTRIAAGNHTMLLTKDGKIYVSGNNDAGQLGDGHYFDSEISDNHYNATTFKPVEKDGVKFRSVTATIYNSYAIASDGALYAWGQNAYGQLGLVSVGTYSGIYTPTKVDDAKWAVVKGRSTTIVGIHTDGTLWAWGKNLHGQLGVGADSETKECATTPEKVSDERWLDCASGYYHSTAVKADGTVGMGRQLAEPGEQQHRHHIHNSSTSGRRHRLDSSAGRREDVGGIESRRLAVDLGKQRRVGSRARCRRQDRRQTHEGVRQSVVIFCRR